MDIQFPQFRQIPKKGQALIAPLPTAVDCHTCFSRLAAVFADLPNGLLNGIQRCCLSRGARPLIVGMQRTASPTAATRSSVADRPNEPATRQWPADPGQPQDRRPALNPEKMLCIGMAGPSSALIDR